jgi:hypothetical protein
MGKLESDFVKDDLKPDLEARFPGIVIIKQDPNTSFQGVPDHLLLYEDKWAALETKRAVRSKRQPNQEFYVEKLNNLSYSAFVHPGNKQQVLDDLECVFHGVCK